MNDSKRARRFAFLLVVIPIAWLFGKPACEDRWLAFRDAANYYQPLFAWEASEWSAGRLPLWNPLDNGGIPAVADATSSAFYPGKLVFLVPCDFQLRLHLYIVSHVILAAGATYQVTRRWGCSRHAASLAAVCYALGGNVLFQSCNVVFLVGAAWLPWAVQATDQLLRHRSLPAAWGLGAVLALMTLGGDPQMAYHVLLGALLYWALLGWAERRGSAARPGNEPPSHSNIIRSRGGLLATAATCGLLLAAVQIFPSWVWTQASDRAAYTAPRNVTELAARAIRPPAASLSQDASVELQASAIWGAPQANTHHASVYQFSVGPWRFLEFFWPNIFGSTWPENRRWISALPAAGRVWTPSMYMGLLPLLLGLGCCRCNAACVRQRWLSWALLLTAVASLGWYGLGWILHEIRCGLGGSATDDYWIGPQVGGLYWLMSTLLPGYIYFRYPAKLMVVASLAASLLAALGWDRMWRRPQRLPRLLLILAGISLALAALAFLSRAPFQAWISTARTDHLFGPLDAAAAHRGLIRALLHTALLSIALRAFLRHAAMEPNSVRAVTFRRLALAATVGEIVLANGPLLVTVPGATLRSPANPVALSIHQDRRLRASTGPPRAYRDHALQPPRQWQSAVAPDRLNEVVTWERATLLPKHHLTDRVGMVESFSTLASRDFRLLLAESRQLGTSPPGLPAAPSRQVLNLLATRYFIVPAPHDRSQAVAKHNPQSFPRAWIVHHVERLPPLRTSDPREIRQRTRQVLLDKNGPRDFTRVAVVEAAAAADLRRLRNVPPPTPAASEPAASDETCQLRLVTPQRIEIDCRLESAGLVVLSDLHYPGWRAYVRTPDQTRRTAVRVYRANRVLRSVYLPAGKYVVAFEYRPSEFYIGAACSAIAWLALAAGVARSLLGAGRLLLGARR